MKSKLLYALVLLLVISNIILLFILIKKPHNKPKGAAFFLVNELQFSEKQHEEFKVLQKAHRKAMRSYDRALGDGKEQLFELISSGKEMDSTITCEIAAIGVKKEQEIFSFLSEVRKICDESQAKKMDKVLKKALHRTGPPPRGPKPPPHDPDLRH